MRRSFYLLPFTFFLCLLVPARASADLTAFIGTNSTPTTRATRGFAVGAGMLIVGFEFEYAHTNDDLEKAAPSLNTYMFNGLLQTPVPIAGMQFYGSLGGGVFHETLSAISETNFGTSVGGGVKWRLAGPVRLRLDYRVFNLHGSALYDNPKRFYAGINLKF